MLCLYAWHQLVGLAVSETYSINAPTKHQSPIIYECSYSPSSGLIILEDTAKDKKRKTEISGRANVSSNFILHLKVCSRVGLV